jgi:hypothetical protein
VITILTMAIPNAEPLPLPAPAWLLWTLLLLTFFLHLIAMNAVLGGSIISAAALARRSSEHHRRLASSIGKVLPTLVAAAVTFGVAPLLFLQALYGRLLFTSSILMGWVWLSVVPILILAYYGTYLIAFYPERFRRVLPWIGGATAVLFLTIAFIYVNNMSLALRPAAFLPMFVENARGTQLNVGDATFLPRFLHMVLGAIAVAGLAVASYGFIARRKDEAWGEWVMRHGAVWFVAATAVNIVVGFWWLFVLPQQVMLRLIGQGAALGAGLAPTLWMGVGILLGIGALALGVMVMTGRRLDLAIRGAWIALGGSMVGMVLVRDEVRRATLEPSGFALTSWTEPQWGVIAIFGALLIAAFATVIWMGMVLLRPKKSETVPAIAETATP